MNREDKIVKNFNKYGPGILQALVLVIIILVLAVVSNRMWGGKPEKIELPVK